VPNRLAHETSPYLLQHANNPVDWYPWGEEALARARLEDKPIFLSIGYAACHWCHVMERESFEREDVAALLNRDFVSIKVDREERPDLDEIYMAATVAVAGGGGWPMSVFLDTEQRPFFAGTYFPPVERWGKPSFRMLLERIAELWRTERSALSQQAAELVSHVRAEFELDAKARVETDATLGAVRELARSFDATYGGFGAAPKFPPPAALALLLRRHHASGDEQALAMAKKTLDGMKDGGMYDQLGGGFARYSTDERWLVPHFEKMLYDNAELARVYLDAFQVTGDAEYRRVARETLDYVAREMQSSAGGYFSATDADSEGVEGKYFVWTFDEIQAELAPEAAEHFAFFYDVTPEGNWEGRSVLHRPRTLVEAARALGVATDALERSLTHSRTTLLAVRAKRLPPLLDDKVITAWNGLMIGAMAEGFRVLRDRRYLASAERAARHLLEKLRRPDGGLFRTLRDGRAHLDGYLEDYAFGSDALVTLYEAGGDVEFLERARELAERILHDFDDAGGGFFGTAAGHESLVARPKDTHDGALPSANAVAARVLVRLGRHFDRPEFVERGRAAIEAYGEFVRRAPRAFATSLGVIELIEAAPLELAVVGEPGSADREALEVALAAHYLPHRVVAHASDTTPASSALPLLRDKTRVAERAALYVCRGYVCGAPVTDPSGVASALAG
jgi:uncharacterized protein YyaL (SSP411 family)